MAGRNLTTNEAAARAQLGESTMRFWRSRGDGPTWYKLGRRVFYPEVELDQWLADQRAQADRLCAELRRQHANNGAA